MENKPAKTERIRRDRIEIAEFIAAYWQSGQKQLAVKPAYRHLSPADFDHAYELAKRMTPTNSAKELFYGAKEEKQRY